MRKLFLITALLIVNLGTTSFAETGTEPDTEAVKRGMPIYEDNCQRCHQEQGVGENIPVGIRDPGFRPAIPLNDNAHAWHHADEQLLNIIGAGNTRMPAFNQILSADEIHDVIAYMKSLWSPRMLACQGPKHMSCM